MWEFTNLVKLQLDNNIIEKIEGLDMLVNLEWLGQFKLVLFIIKSIQSLVEKFGLKCLPTCQIYSECFVTKKIFQKCGIVYY